MNFNMNITSITRILQQLHVLHTLYICIILFTSVVKMTYFCNMWAANLFNVHKNVRARPSTWFVPCLLPSLGPKSRWDECGGNSMSVRSTELIMQCSDFLFEGWNEQTGTTEKLEVETHIFKQVYQ
jgi:hypothetical protein